MNALGATTRFSGSLVSPTSDDVRQRRCGRREAKKRTADGPYSGGRHVGLRVTTRRRDRRGRTVFRVDEDVGVLGIRHYLTRTGGTG